MQRHISPALSTRFTPGLGVNRLTRPHQTHGSRHSPNYATLLALAGGGAAGGVPSWISDSMPSAQAYNERAARPGDEVIPDYVVYNGEVSDYVRSGRS